LQHIPVLLEEIKEAFAPCTLGLFIDGTVGLGGHLSCLLKEHSEIKRAIAIDQDFQALEIAKQRLSVWDEKIEFVEQNFAQALEELSGSLAGQVDGILLDIGVSSLQLDTPQRGFSFRNDGPLDMRMDKRASLTAEEFINDYPIEKVAGVIRTLGEEKHWRKIAQAIERERGKTRISTTKHLAELIWNLGFPKEKVHPATKTFQAVRIFINDELGVLKKGLEQALSLLSPKGRLAVITFHSLEDRIVKKFFSYKALDKVSTSGIGGVFIDKEPEVILPYRKPILPSDEEILQNPRSRSAKLRVCEKR